MFRQAFVSDPDPEIPDISRAPRARSGMKDTEVQGARSTGYPRWHLELRRSELSRRDVAACAS